MTKEILDIKDVQQLVFSFYEKVRNDAMLSVIFNERIKDRWPQHLEKMVKFWQTILLNEHTYFGTPFVPHADLPIDAKHFDRWLELFYENINEQFSGEKAKEAKWRAEKMAEMFQIKIAHYRTGAAKPII